MKDHPQSTGPRFIRAFARTVVFLFGIFFAGIFLLGCGGGGALTIPPPMPSDEQNIPKPEKQKINNIADGFDKQFAQPTKRAFDISRQLRKLTGNKKEAFNVDAFDEVANSSWFTNRNGMRRMALDEIQRGPDRGRVPDMSGTLKIIGAKTEGVTPGFTIEDVLGGRYIIKFDPPGWPELATGAEVVSTKLMYAAGYNTPENYIVYFDPAMLELTDGVMIRDKKTGLDRQMTPEDLDAVVGKLDRGPNGKVRAVASKFIAGSVLGPFRYSGTRKDDPNDFVPHQYRRELRGLGQIAAWINHWDTKAANTLDVYVEQDGRHFVRHYLIDFGSTLGSQGDEPMPEWVGFETGVDPGQMLVNTAGVGLYVPKWEKNRSVQYRSIGLFGSRDFEPRSFKYIVPNPAFVNLTNRDGFWAAAIVTSFSDEQIRAAVETGQYTNPAAAEYLVGVLVQRRDIVGRYWFDKMNPAADFAVEGTANGEQLTWRDLSVERGYTDPSQVVYAYEFKADGKTLEGGGQVGESMSISLPDVPHGILEVRIRNGKNENEWGSWVSVFLDAAESSGHYTVVAVQRED